MWLGQLERISATEHHINHKPGTLPVHQMTYRQGTDRRKVTFNDLGEQLQAGVNEPENREWESTVALVIKKYGKL